MTEERLQRAQGWAEHLIEQGDPEPLDQAVDFWAEVLEGYGQPELLALLDRLYVEMLNARRKGEAHHFSAELALGLMDWAVEHNHSAVFQAAEEYLEAQFVAQSGH